MRSPRPLLVRAIARAFGRALGCGLAGVLAVTGALAQARPDCPSPAEPLDAVQVDAAVPNAPDRGFLWRISKGGHSSFLYGTLHVAKAGWTVPGPAVRAALDASDRVALELDMLDPDTQQEIARGMLGRAGDGTPFPYVAALPYELRDRLQKLAAAACLPWEFMQMLSPRFALGALAGAVVRRDGFDPAYGIDGALNAWARRTGMPVDSLETVEIQLQAMRGAGDTGDETLAAVRTSLDELESPASRPLLLRLTRVWEVGDLASLSSYERWCECMKTDADRAEMRRVLDARNPGLADRIDRLHAAGDRVFAAVGSLHMIGPAGLPALMARRGYRVERIAYNKLRETTP